MTATGPTFSSAHPRLRTPAQPPWFEDLIVLMTEGRSHDDHLLGVVRAQVLDDGGQQFEYRVARKGRLSRCSSLDGTVHVIAGQDMLWTRSEYPGDDIRTHPVGGYIYSPDDYEFGLQRPSRQRWDGDDFTTPTGPPRELSFLGRRAWEIELAPPAHKPHPMQMIVDADSGLVLRQANAALGGFAEWIELDTDADLADELFTWQDEDIPATRYR